MVELFANSGDPDQTTHSDLGRHCLPINLLGISRLQWVNACGNKGPVLLYIFFLGLSRLNLIAKREDIESCITFSGLSVFLSALFSLSTIQDKQNKRNMKPCVRVFGCSKTHGFVNYFLKENL